MSVVLFPVKRLDPRVVNFGSAAAVVALRGHPVGERWALDLGAGNRPAAATFLEGALEALERTLVKKAVVGSRAETGLVTAGGQVLAGEQAVAVLFADVGRTEVSGRGRFVFFAGGQEEKQARA